MLMALSGPSRPPLAGGKPRRLVILLHGLGADGNDLIGLQQYWGRLRARRRVHLAERAVPVRHGGLRPSMVQRAGPHPGGDAGRGARRRAVARCLIDEELQKRGLTESDAALVGFSQGTMMSLFVGLRRERPLAGILGYSGRLIAPELLAGELRSRPPVLLVHGTEDPLVPFESMATAGDGAAKPPACRSRRWPAPASSTRSIRRGCSAAAASCARCSAPSAG